MTVATTVPLDVPSQLITRPIARSATPTNRASHAEVRCDRDRTARESDARAEIEGGSIHARMQAVIVTSTSASHRGSSRAMTTMPASPRSIVRARNTISEIASRRGSAHFAGAGHRSGDQRRDARDADPHLDPQAARVGTCGWSPRRSEPASHRVNAEESNGESHRGTGPVDGECLRLGSGLGLVVGC